MCFKVNLLFILAVFSLFNIKYLCSSKSVSPPYVPPKNCDRPYDRGPCFSEDMRISRTFQWRYWFDVYESFDCERFEYGGCGGNGNNYLSYQECYDECYDKYTKHRQRKTINLEKERNDYNIRRGNTDF